MSLQVPDWAENYQEEFINFCLYWSEPTKTGKLRAETEKTFEIKRRFATWMRNKKQFHSTTTKNKICLEL